MSLLSSPPSSPDDSVGVLSTGVGFGFAQSSSSESDGESDSSESVGVLFAGVKFQAMRDVGNRSKSDESLDSNDGSVTSSNSPSDTRIKIKWSGKNNKSSPTTSANALLKIFRRRRDNLAQRIKRSNKTMVPTPTPQPLLLPVQSKSSPDMSPLRIGKNNIDQTSNQCNTLLFSSLDRSHMSDTAELSLSSTDSTLVTSNHNKEIHTASLRANIYAGSELLIEENIYRSQYNSSIDLDGFIDESSASSSIIETLQNEVNQLKEELTQTKKRLDTANSTNEALNDAHDEKHQELGQLNADMDRFSDVIMLCMQQLRERNVALANENEELKSSAEDMRQRMDFLTRCTEALNDAHDRKSEECEVLKREKDAFAETVAKQHNDMQELEGRLRNVMAENEDLKKKCTNEDLGLRV